MTTKCRAAPSCCAVRRSGAAARTLPGPGRQVHLAPRAAVRRALRRPGGDERAGAGRGQPVDGARRWRRWASTSSWTAARPRSQGVGFAGLRGAGARRSTAATRGPRIRLLMGLRRRAAVRDRAGRRRLADPAADAARGATAAQDGRHHRRAQRAVAARRHLPAAARARRLAAPASATTFRSPAPSSRARWCSPGLQAAGAASCASRRARAITPNGCCASWARRSPPTTRRGALIVDPDGWNGRLKRGPHRGPRRPVVGDVPADRGRDGRGQRRHRRERRPQPDPHGRAGRAAGDGRRPARSRRRATRWASRSGACARARRALRGTRGPRRAGAARDRRDPGAGGGGGAGRGRHRVRRSGGATGQGVRPHRRRRARAAPRRRQGRGTSRTASSSRAWRPRARRRHVKPDHDHRIAMAGAILGLVVARRDRASRAADIATSFPSFADDPRALGAPIA